LFKNQTILPLSHLGCISQSNARDIIRNKITNNKMEKYLKKKKQKKTVLDKTYNLP